VPVSISATCPRRSSPSVAPFERALLPLDSAGKLGVVLFQFRLTSGPVTGSETMSLAAGAPAPVPARVEFRHGSWVTGQNLSATLGFVREHSLAWSPWMSRRVGRQPAAGRGGHRRYRGHPFSRP